MRSSLVRFVPILMLSVAMTGCAGTPKTMVPVTGTLKASIALPYTRLLDDARADVRKNVEPYMKDDAAKKYRDQVVTEMSDKYHDFTTGSDPNIRKKLIEGVLLNDFKKALTGDKVFHITKWVPDRQEISGDVSSFDVHLNENGTFAGHMGTGLKFSCNDYYGRRAGDAYEYYKFLLSGSYASSEDSLEVTYKIDLVQYITGVGLDSEVDRNVFTHSIGKLDVSSSVANQITKLKNDVNSYYDGAVLLTTSKIVDRLKSRVHKENKGWMNVKETSVRTNFETAVARLQRRLDRFQFEKGSSTFEFMDSNKTLEFYGIQTSLPSGLAVKLFPEKSGTVAVFQVKCTTAVDEMTGRPLYTAEQAVKDYGRLIAQIEGILK